MSSFFFPALTRRTAHLSSYATISCFSESTKGEREKNNVFAYCGEVLSCAFIVILCFIEITGVLVITSATCLVVGIGVAYFFNVRGPG